MSQTISPAALEIAMAIQKAMSPQQGGVMNKALTGAAQGPYLHGPGGIFGVRGLSRGVISTVTQMTGSLGEIIPVRSSGPTADQNPLFPYITGFVRSDTQEKNGVCDDPEEAGHFLTCLQTAFWGRKEYKSRELEVTRLGDVINRGEFTDLLLENAPLVNSMGGMMRDFVGLRGQTARIGGEEMVTRMIEMGLSFQRWFCPKVYTGNPNKSSAGGGYREFTGLDLLINNNNKPDAQTGAQCPGLYSDVKSFSYRDISSATDPTIHRTLSTMMYILETRAKQNNLAPVEFAIVMRSQLFWELSRIWPLQYNTQDSGLSNAGLDNLYLSMTAERDAMRRENYIMINAKRYRVVLDDCIFEENRSVNSTIPIGGFASDIYIVPLRARGGSLETLYWEYKDFNQTVLPELRKLPTWFWSDNGMFLWTMSPPLNWCLDIKAVTIPRLILRTPQLAGRLTDVVYTPLQHINDPLPSQYYHVSGGQAGRPLASPYSEWNPAGPGIPS
jgi:hypothetical protein